jgi:hypothetical protein
LTEDDNTIVPLHCSDLQNVIKDEFKVPEQNEMTVDLRTKVIGILCKTLGLG